MMSAEVRGAAFDYRVTDTASAEFAVCDER